MFRGQAYEIGKRRRKVTKRRKSGREGKKGKRRGKGEKRRKIWTAEQLPAFQSER